MPSYSPPLNGVFDGSRIDSTSSRFSLTMSASTRRHMADLAFCPRPTALVPVAARRRSSLVQPSVSDLERAYMVRVYFCVTVMVRKCLLNALFELYYRKGISFFVESLLR